MDIARELLTRTRNISACLDSMVRPHQRVIELRGELSKGPFAELGCAKQALEADLRSIEDLLAKGMVNEAWSAISLYEGRVGLMLPSLHRLAGMKRGSRALGMTSSELDAVEERILAHDVRGAESAMDSLCSVAAGPAAGLAGRSPPGGGSACALCGRTIRGDFDLCPYCGFDPRAPTAECPECGGIVLLSFRSCPTCGKRLPARAREGNTVLSSLMIG